MKFLVVLFLSTLPYFLQAQKTTKPPPQYNKLEWTDCGSKEVQFYEIDVTPMPIIQPGDAYLTFKADLKRDLQGNLKTDINIIRSVSGVPLPVRW